MGAVVEREGWPNDVYYVDRLVSFGRESELQTLHYCLLAQTVILIDRNSFYIQVIKMEANICSIQVLLQAAEFLERRERGRLRIANNLGYLSLWLRNETNNIYECIHFKYVIDQLFLKEKRRLFYKSMQ